MKIISITPNRPQEGGPRTATDLGRLIGQNAHYIGAFDGYYKQHTISYLTEALGNVHQLEKGGKFSPINAMAYEFDIKLNHIHIEPMVAVPVGTGENKSDIKFYFRNNYYHKGDIFRVDATGQQFIVTSRERRTADNKWEVTAKLNDANYSTKLMLNNGGVGIGSKTRWIGVVFPEISEEGFTKSNRDAERHRNNLSRFRHDITWTSEFEAMEQSIVKAKAMDNNNRPIGIQFTITNKEIDLITTYKDSKNLTLLTSRSNMDKAGKCMIQDETGQDLTLGDGLIPQLERYCGQTFITKNSRSAAPFKEAMNYMRQTSPITTQTGNNWLAISNFKGGQWSQEVLFDTLKGITTANASYFFSKEAGKDADVSVGANFTSYNWMGNKLSFKEDPALSLLYPDEAYIVIINLASDSKLGEAALEYFTLKGQEFKRSIINGVGSGSSDAVATVASPLTASRLAYTGTGGVGYFRPFDAYIIREAKY